MADPDTPDAWLALCTQHEVVAKLAADNATARAQAVFHVGLAVEAALKAYIMKAERLNSWPSRSARKDLYTHDIRVLLSLSRLQIGAKDKVAPAWHVVAAWDRNQGYDPNPMPRRVVSGWIEAAFGTDGVVTWLRAKLT